MRRIPPWVAAYIGIPFQARGRTLETGVDCYGLLRLVLGERFQCELPEYLGYGRNCDPAEVGSYVVEHLGFWREIEPGRERAGDALLLKCLGEPMHVALVVAPGAMLHTFRKACSRVEDYTAQKWRDRVIAIYRHESMAA